MSSSSSDIVTITIHELKTSTIFQAAGHRKKQADEMTLVKGLELDLGTFLANVPLPKGQ